MTTTASISIPNLAETAPSEISHYTHVLPSPFNNTSPPPELLTQGAEALVYRTTFLDSSTPAALKFRPSKPYRHPTLDQRLTKQRVLAEARVLVKLSPLKKDGISVPAVFSLEWDVARKVKNLSDDQKATSQSRNVGGGAWLLMEWIDGKSVKQLLRDWDAWFKAAGKDASDAEMKEAEKNVKILLRKLGRAVAAMHSKGGVVHGDLTSSNIMVRPLPSSEQNGTTIDSEQRKDSAVPPDMDGEIVLIDFGLATQSLQDEDRAVDLYVLERAFGSTHPKQEDWFDAEVLQCQDGYRGGYKGASVVLKKLEEVRLRGRKRSMIG